MPLPGGRAELNSRAGALTSGGVGRGGGGIPFEKVFYDHVSWVLLVILTPLSIHCKQSQIWHVEYENLCFHSGVGLEDSGSGEDRLPSWACIIRALIVVFRITFLL